MLPRLLLLEDCHDAARALSRLLTRLGWEVTTAATIAAAAQACEQASEPFDLLVADVMVPDGDGRTLLARLPEALRPRLSVVYSAIDGDREVAASRSAGFVDHLVKPMLDLETLQKWMTQAVEARAALLEGARSGHGSSGEHAGVTAV